MKVETVLRNEQKRSYHEGIEHLSEETLKASEIFQIVWVDSFRSLSVNKADLIQNACTACLFVVLSELCISSENGANLEGKQKSRAYIDEWNNKTIVNLLAKECIVGSFYPRHV